MLSNFARRAALWSLGACLALVTVPAVAQTELKPVAVVTATSYQQLLSEIDFLGSLAGQKKAGQQLEGTVALFTQGQGLVGLKKDQPWGVVLQTDGFQFMPLVCLPVEDFESMLGLVQGMGVETKDAGEGVTEITGPNQSVFVKHADGWAFVAQQADALAAAPADAAAMFNKCAETYDLGVQLFVANVPDMYKQMALQEMQKGMDQGLQQEADESDDTFAQRKRVAELQYKQLSRLVEEMGEVQIGLAVDGEQKKLLLDFLLTPTPGTETATEMTAAKPGPTMFGGFYASEPAISFLGCSTTAAEIIAKQKEQLELTFSNMRQQAANEIEKSDELANDEMRESLKTATNELIDALEETVASGSTDLAVNANVEADTLNLIGAFKLIDPAKVESALKKFDAAAKEKGPDYPGITWDAESHNGVRMHTLSVPLPESTDEKARMLLGESLDVAVGIGEEAAYFAIGRDSMTVLKTAIDGSSSAMTGKTGELAIALAPILRAAAAMAPPEQQPMLSMFAEKLSLAEPGQDHIRFGASSEGDTMRMRLEVESGVLQAAGEAAAAAREAGVGAGL